MESSPLTNREKFAKLASISFHLHQEQTGLPVLDREGNVRPDLELNICADLSDLAESTPLQDLPISLTIHTTHKPEQWYASWDFYITPDDHVGSERFNRNQKPTKEFPSVKDPPVETLLRNGLSYLQPGTLIEDHITHKTSVHHIRNSRPKKSPILKALERNGVHITSITPNLGRPDEDGYNTDGARYTAVVIPHPS